MNNELLSEYDNRVHEAEFLQGERKSGLIDLGLVKLIRALWDCGVDTDQSCQEVEKGVAHIMFSDGLHAEQFMKQLVGHPFDWDHFWGLNTTLHRDRREILYIGYNGLKVPVWNRPSNVTEVILFPSMFIPQWTAIAERWRAERNKPK